jgi:hypothetical protein
MLGVANAEQPLQRFDQTKLFLDFSLGGLAWRFVQFDNAAGNFSLRLVGRIDQQNASLLIEKKSACAHALLGQRFLIRALA